MTKHYKPLIIAVQLYDAGSERWLYPMCRLWKFLIESFFGGFWFSAYGGCRIPWTMRRSAGSSIFFVCRFSRIFLPEQATKSQKFRWQSSLYTGTPHFYLAKDCRSRKTTTTTTRSTVRDIAPHQSTSSTANQEAVTNLVRTMKSML